jgi:protein TonB
MQLLESHAARRGSRVGSLVSVAVHLVVIAAAVVATAHAGVSPAREPREHLAVYVAPPEPPATRSTAPTGRRSVSGAPTLARSLPALPPLPTTGPVPDLATPDRASLDPSRGLAESFRHDLAVGGLGDGDAGAGPSGAPYDASLVDRAAAPLAPVRPRYPEPLRAAGIGGRAVVRFVVDTLGRVEAGSVTLVSATHPLFGDAAVRAVPSLRFRPAEAHGRPVRQLVELPFEFRIE